MYLLSWMVSNASFMCPWEHKAVLQKVMCSLVVEHLTTKVIHNKDPNRARHLGGHGWNLT